MLKDLPATADTFLAYSWADIQPFYQELLAAHLDADEAAVWLADWTRLSDLVSESLNRLQVATTQDTADQQAELRYNAYLDGIFSPAQAAEQQLKQKLLASGLKPAGMDNPLRKMQAEADLFAAANLPLLAQERKLGFAYNKIIGAQTIVWDGQEVTLQQLRPVYYQPDRGRRAAAWQAAAGRQLADRAAINALWVQQLDLRSKLAENAGQPDYRAYRLRFHHS